MPRPKEIRTEVSLICSHQQPRHDLEEVFYLYEVDCGIILPEMNELIANNPVVNKKLTALADHNLKHFDSLDTEITEKQYKALLRKLKKLSGCTNGIVTSPSNAQGNCYLAFDYTFVGRSCDIENAGRCSHLKKSLRPATITKNEFVTPRTRSIEVLDALRSKPWPGDKNRKVEVLKTFTKRVLSSAPGSDERILATHQFDDALTSEKWQSRHQKRIVLTN